MSGGPREWWSVHPTTGEVVRVAPADRVASAQRAAFDAQNDVAVLREAAARARVMFRRTRQLPDSTEEEIEQARAELRDALEWMHRGRLDAVGHLDSGDGVAPRKEHPAPVKQRKPRT